MAYFIHVVVGGLLTARRERENVNFLYSWTKQR